MTATTECGRREGRSSTTSLPDPAIRDGRRRRGRRRYGAKGRCLSWAAPAVISSTPCPSIGARIIGRGGAHKVRRGSPRTYPHPGATRSSMGAVRSRRDSRQPGLRSAAFSGGGVSRVGGATAPEQGRRPGGMCCSRRVLAGHGFWVTCGDRRRRRSRPGLERWGQPADRPWRAGPSSAPEATGPQPRRRLRPSWPHLRGPDGRPPWPRGR